MSRSSSESTPRVRETDSDRGEARPILPERERWAYVRAAYPLNRGIPHFLDFPGGEA
jgi:hypothetical protein